MTLPEIWVECFNGDLRNYGPSQAQMIGRAMSRIAGWVQDGMMRHPKYGRQRTYKCECAPITGTDENLDIID